ncbi:MAG: hypothetical protein ACUVQY_10355, partial [Thermoproteota archaeon]
YFLKSVESVSLSLQQYISDPFSDSRALPPDQGLVDAVRSVCNLLGISIDAATREIAELNALLRTRMDFVADIATAQKPPPAMGISLLNALLIPFAKPVLFWDQLAASHGLSHKDIVFHFRVGSKNVNVKAGSGNVSTENPPEEIITAIAGIPNGIIGCQAFYCIIENLIRNVVKHCERPDQTSLEITIQLERDGDWKNNDDLMKVIIYDNWGACHSRQGLEQDINKRLQERVIRNDGSIIASNRGLKEMKVAAAYLRGLTPEAVDEPQVEPSLLRAVNIGDNLGYEFFLLKPKELLVSIAENVIPPDKLNSLKRQGIEIVTDKSELLVKGRDHPILLVMLDDESIKSLLEDPNNASDLPLRVIFIQDDGQVVARSGSWCQVVSSSSVSGLLDKIRNRLKQGDGLVAISCVWELWTRITCGDFPPKLWIYEDENLRLWNIEGISSLVGKNDNPDASTRVVLYARHGYSKRDHKSILFYEPYGKGVDLISFVLENPLQKEEARKALVYRLIDAGLTPILVIDERVQEAAYSVTREFPEDPERAKEMEMAFWLGLMRVYVPAKEKLNLERKELNRNEIEDWIKEKIQELRPFNLLPPILIIHQGLLDVVGLGDPAAAQGWIDNLRNTANSSICDIIVTSGRGIPDNIPPRARFIPLSTLLHYLVERKSKFHLVQSLLATRRVGK